MRRTLTLLGLPLLVAACGTKAPNELSGGTGASNASSGAGAGMQTSAGVGGQPAKTALDDRVTDYGEAYRTASIKLVGELPSLQQVQTIANASDKAKAYSDAIDTLFADPRFNAQMVAFWRDAMRIGGDPTMDAAPVLAAQIMAEGQPYTNLFTATKGTCPTFDSTANTFTAADCSNGVTTHAGVLTNPGVMKQFYSNMGFRRVRWVQEVFVCTKFPAEVVASPTQVDGKDYTSPWDFHSIATAPINFQDTSGVVCANCHTTINHVAPLFGNFDENGQMQSKISVVTPVVPTPTPTKMTDWLQPGETTHWRNGEAAPDLPSLGAAMAKDSDVAACAVTRMWNFAMSKEDVVNDLATVPPTVIAPYMTSFTSNGMNLKATLKAMLLSDDFTKF